MYYKYHLGSSPVSIMMAIDGSAVFIKENASNFI